ncbi:MAG: hypothetical protein KAI72_01235 [Candidatus Pacebacteria bacterium]|nr:hypothetical protein [Candidatus Paceibacterota bacterium]
MSQKYKNYIQSLKPSKLSSVDYHEDMSGIERFVSEAFPLHVAVHKVKERADVPQKYVELHQHDVLEINIILGSDDKPLKYNIQLGDENYTVQSPAIIRIPANLSHSANLIIGSGTFISIVMTKDYHAFSEDK